MAIFQVSACAALRPPMASPSQSRMEGRIPHEEWPIAPELLKDEPMLFASMRASLRSMKGFSFIFALAINSLFVGCSSGGGKIVIGHSDSVRFRLPPEVSSVLHERATPYDIEVIDISDTSRPFIVIGLAEAETTTLHEAVDRLRQEASKIGGDAILDLLPTPGGNTTMGVPLLGDLSFRSGRIWTARVIRWLPAGTTLKNAPNSK